MSPRTLVSEILGETPQVGVVTHRLGHVLPSPEVGNTSMRTLTCRAGARGALAGALVAAVALTVPAASAHATDSSRRAESAESVLSLIHISEPTRRTPISYAVFCLK